MSNLYKTVRIVHSPEEKRFYVQQKKIFRFRWDTLDSFEYVDKVGTSPLGCHDLLPAALEKAKARASMFLARTVIWEQSNWSWQ